MASRRLQRRLSPVVEARGWFASGLRGDAAKRRSRLARRRASIWSGRLGSATNWAAISCLHVGVGARSNPPDGGSVLIRSSTASWRVTRRGLVASDECRSR